MVRHYFMDPVNLWSYIKGLNPSPASTISTNYDIDKIRPIGFLTLVTLSSEPEMSQNLGILALVSLSS